ERDVPSALGGASWPTLSREFLRLFFLLLLYHPKSPVIRCGLTLFQLGIGRLVSAAAHELALAVLGRYPFGRVAAEVEDARFAHCLELAHFLDKRLAGKSRDFLAQLFRVVGIDGVAGPVVERVLAVLVAIKVVAFF